MSIFDFFKTKTDFEIQDGVLKKYHGSGKNVTIPDGVTTIGKSAFQACNSLISVTIPSSVTTIEQGAFLGCLNLTSVNILDSVTTIGKFAFDGCWKLKEVSLSRKTKIITNDIHNNTFDINTKIIYREERKPQTEKQTPIQKTQNTKFVIENHVLLKYQGNDSSVTIPNSVTTIGERAFYHCQSLISVKISDSVTKIENSAFSFCENLTSVNIPSSMTTIGELAFFHCKSLNSVTIPNSVNKIGQYAFDSNTKIIREEKKPQTKTSPPAQKVEKVEFIIKNNILLKYQGNERKVIIPDSVTEIAANAFSECPGVTEISLIMGVKFRGNSFPPDAEIIFRQPEQKKHTRKTVLTFAPLTESEINALPETPSVPEQKKHTRKTVLTFSPLTESELKNLSPKGA